MYGEDLIQAPQETLQAANQFLDLGISTEQINNIVDSDNRHQDAKSKGQKFSVQKRQNTYQKLEGFYGEDLENV